MSGLLNNTTSYARESVNTLTKVVTTTYITTGTLSLLGNTLVMAVMLQRFRKASIFKILLSHLAFCDMVFAMALLFDIPNWINKEWVYPNSVCKIIPSAQFTSSIAAEGTVVVIAIERYRGISRPLSVRWNKYDVSLALLITWCLAFVSGSPFIHVLRVITVGDQTKQCVEYWSDDIAEHSQAAFFYSTFTFIANFLLPMIMLAVLYGRIILLIRRPIQHVSSFEQIFRKRRQKDIRITKLLILVIVAFALCVLPNHLGHFIVSKITLTSAQRDIMDYIMLIPYPFQCVLNPLIYSIVDKKFRREAYLVLRCQPVTNRRISRTMTSFFKSDSMCSKKISQNGLTLFTSIPNKKISQEEEQSF